MPPAGTAHGGTAVEGDGVKVELLVLQGQTKRQLALM